MYSNQIFKYKANLLQSVLKPIQKERLLLRQVPISFHLFLFAPSSCSYPSDHYRRTLIQWHRWILHLLRRSTLSQVALNAYHFYAHQTNSRWLRCTSDNNHNKHHFRRWNCGKKRQTFHSLATLLALWVIVFFFRTTVLGLWIFMAQKEEIRLDL